MARLYFLHSGVTGHLTWPSDLTDDLAWPRIETFTKMQKYGGSWRWKPGGAVRRCYLFSCYSRKTLGEVSAAPPIHVLLEQKQIFIGKTHFYAYFDLKLTLASGGGVDATPPPWVFLSCTPNRLEYHVEIFYSLWGVLCATFGEKKFGQVRSGHEVMTSQREQPSARFQRNRE